MNSFPLLPKTITHLFIKEKFCTDLWLKDTTKWPACKSGPAFLGIFIDIYVIIVFLIQNLSPHMISVCTTSWLLVEANDNYLGIIFYQRLAPLLHCVYAALCHWLNTYHYHHHSLHKGLVGVYARIKNASTRSCGSIVEAATESTTSVP